MVELGLEDLVDGRLPGRARPRSNRLGIVVLVCSEWGSGGLTGLGTGIRMLNRLVHDQVGRIVLM